MKSYFILGNEIQVHHQSQFSRPLLLSLLLEREATLKGPSRTEDSSIGGMRKGLSKTRKVPRVDIVVLRAQK